MKLLRSGPRRLVIPNTTAPQVRYPDPRGLIVPTPASTGSNDYDEFTINASWQEYETDTANAVKYFCYDITQVDPITGYVDHYFKAVRLIRLTRVPRYLRTVSGGTGAHVFTQMRDVLVGLREKGIFFCHIIAKTPQIPLIFAYGVQGLGDTMDDARELADEAYAALSVNLDGTYQQLEYQPITAAEGQLLSRYQTEWNHVAIARGRPMPQGASVGSSSAFDGNRTDVENTNNQLESFIRAMVDRSFVMTLVTTPLTMDDMQLGWKNVTKHLSAVRSDTDGTRGFSAAVGIPVGMGSSTGDTSGTTHGESTTDTTGTADQFGTNTSHAVGTSLTDTLSHGASTTQTDGTSTSDTHTDGQSSTLGANTSLTDTTNASQTHTQGVNEGVSTNASVGQTNTEGQSLAVGQNQSIAQGSNYSQSEGVTTGQSLSASSTSGSNWSSGVNQGSSNSSGWNQGTSDSLSQSTSASHGSSAGTSQGNTQQDGSSFSGGLPGLSGGQNTAHGFNSGVNSGTNDSYGMSQSSGSTNNQGVSGGFSTNQGISESSGGSVTNGTSATNSVGTTSTATAGQSLTATNGSSVTNTGSTSVANATTLGQGTNTGTSLSNASGVGSASALSQGANQTAGTTAAHATGTGTNTSVASGTSTGSSTASGLSNTNTEGVSAAQTASNSQALADSFSVAMSRQAMQTGSLGLIPTMSASVTKQTKNEAKRMLGDLLQSKADRYQDGIEGGGLLYQLFLITPDRPLLVAASSMMKNVFWGAGSRTHRLDAPFHTYMVEDEDEAARIRTHASAFSAYLRREPTAGIMEPYLYSTFATTGEIAVLCHPPTTEAPGLQAQADSMPVLSMPADRTNRQLRLGRIVNGERGRVSELPFSVDADELTHTMVQGVTGLGKTTTMMKLLTELAKVSNTVTTYDDPTDPTKPSTTELPASALVLDWMDNARKLANVLPADRFRFFSVTDPSLGEFRFNPLHIPDYAMDPTEWLQAVSDQLSASFGLADFGRNLISEQVDTLFSANRLQPFTLLDAVIDPDTGAVTRPELMLPPVAEADLPPGAVEVDGAGNRYANVYTCPELSRLVGMPELATLVAARVQFVATVEGARLEGNAMRDRLQSLWRRLQNFAPGGPLAQVLAADPDWATRECVTVPDLLNPHTGLFTVVETDGLSMEGRRVVIGSLMLAIYRYGLFHPNRPFDVGGKGPGSYIFLEEAHELFGAADGNESRTDASHRAQLYESMFRRGRQTGLKLVALTQNCSQVPAGVVSQTTTMIAHNTTNAKDRDVLMSQLNWTNQMGQQQREYRYFGEMPAGWAIVRMKPKTSYLEAQPVQIVIDDPNLPDVSDEQLRAMNQARLTGME